MNDAAYLALLIFGILLMVASRIPLRSAASAMHGAVTVTAFLCKLSHALFMTDANKRHVYFFVSFVEVRIPRLSVNKTPTSPSPSGALSKMYLNLVIT